LLTCQCFIPIQPLLAQWFDRKLSFAVVCSAHLGLDSTDQQGIGAAGSGLGGLILSNVTRVTLEKYGVKWSLIINGLISLVCLVPTIILFKSRHKKVGSRVASFQLKWLVHAGYIWVILWGFFSRTFFSIPVSAILSTFLLSQVALPSITQLTCSAHVLHRPLLARLIRNFRPRSHSNPRRSPSIDPISSSNDRSSSLGYRSRLRRSDQHGLNLLLHLRSLMPSHMVTSKFIRCLDLLRYCPRIYRWNDLVSRYSDYGPSGRCKRCRFGFGYILGGLCTVCVGWSAYCGCVVGVLAEGAGEAGGGGILYLDWVMWWYGCTECFMFVWGKALSAGNLEITGNYMSRQ
jgi:hypothetical protein